MFKKFIFTCCLLTSTNLTFAEANPCELEEGQEIMSQSQMNECANYENHKTDVKLNQTYKELINSLTDSSTKKALIKAQRSWIAFRDSECKFNNIGSIYGSIYTLELNSCIKEMTEARIKTLALLLQGK